MRGLTPGGDWLGLLAWLGAVLAGLLLGAAPLRAQTDGELAPFFHDPARPEVLVLDGDITRRTPNLFGLALQRHPGVRVLDLSSFGGDAYAAMAMVPTIRAAGLATRIPAGATCRSACSFLYFAGNERVAEGDLGVHQLASGNEASGHFIMNDVLDLFDDLGIPDTVRRRMMQTPPDEMYIFPRDELAALGLIGPAAWAPPTDRPTDPPTDHGQTDPGQTEPGQTEPPEVAKPDPVQDPPVAGGPPRIALEIAGEANGRVVIELDDDLAPLHVERLLTLVADGAYDGVVFHRVVDGFMAQTGDVEFGKAGGDMSKAGTGGSSYPDLPAEFSDTPFVAGTVGMARAADPDSANSQFFIMFKPVPSLDGSYTVVGQVVEGFDVVRAIKRGDAASGAVDGAPDRIVSATVLSGGARALAAAGVPDAEIADAAVHPRLEYRFDLVDEAMMRLHVFWELPAERGAVIGCEGGTVRDIGNGIDRCTMNFGFTAETLASNPAWTGISYRQAADGSREFSLDPRRNVDGMLLAEAALEALKGAQMRVAVSADEILETTGSLSTDGTSADILIPIDALVDNAGAGPEPFVTRFR